MTTSDPPDNKKQSNSPLKKGWTDGTQIKIENLPALFKPNEVDIIVSQTDGTIKIFHGRDITYDTIERLEYDQIRHTFQIIRKNGEMATLGVIVNHRLHPFIIKQNMIRLQRTKERKTLENIERPLIQKNAEKSKD